MLMEHDWKAQLLCPMGGEWSESEVSQRLFPPISPPALDTFSRAHASQERGARPGATQPQRTSLSSPAGMERDERPVDSGAQLATTPRGPEASLLLHFEELEARQSSSESGCFKDLHGINLPHWPLGKDVANRTWTSCKKIRGIRESLCWSISTPLSHPEWPPPLNPSLWMAI